MVRLDYKGNKKKNLNPECHKEKPLLFRNAIKQVIFLSRIPSDRVTRNFQQTKYKI